MYSPPFMQFNPELPYSFETQLFFLLVSFLLIILIAHKHLQDLSIRSQYSLPPGPWGLPIIGAAFRIGSDNYKDFLKLSEEYGDVYSLYIGSRLAVVLNGSEAIHDALVKNSLVFAGRPDLVTMEMAGQGGRGILNATYGKKWQILRKTSFSAIHKYLTTKDVLYATLNKGRHHLIEQLHNNQATPYDVMSALKSTTATVILGALFGDDYCKQDVDKILALSDSFRETVGCGLAIDFMPWLKYFPNPQLDRLSGIMDQAKSVISKLYFENKSSYKRGTIRNLADSLLEGVNNLKDKQRQNPILDCNSNLVEGEGLPTDDLDSIMVLVDLFGAGFDTSSITLYFAIAYLVKYPHVQRKAQEELDQVIGRHRMPRVSDLDNLHYTNACVYELLRICALAPLSVPHSTTSDVIFRGYFIPKGTVVFVNLWSVLRDPKLWKDPDVFDPTRFLDDKGHVISPRRLPKFLPFSTGRRACVGRSLAEVELPFLLASLVHQFEFTSAESGEEKKKTVKTENGLTLKPAKYEVIIKVR
ncbi:cytochrome P450 1A1-like [Actinia tenebrosa]|uniref:unspecific monooxygenase n=1 Tax=Actinia tenebrosa TaxID=6105 RepID=A0A6P8H209_ACTTE|nr:cytochrome P450 1A1-like [Actinia tenebrosa]